MFIAPDWRIESQYPSPTDQTDLSFWAWQFLRRNPDYQKAWLDYVENMRLISERSPILFDFIQWHIDPDFIVTEKFKGQIDELSMQAWVTPGYIQLDNNRRGLDFPISVGMGLEWGINVLQNPALKNIASSNFTVRGVDVLYYGMERKPSGKLNERQFAYVKGEANSIEIKRNPYFADDQIESGFLSNGEQQVTRLDDDEAELFMNVNYACPIFDLRFPVDVLTAQFKHLLGERELRIKSGMLETYPGRPERSVRLFSTYLRVLDADDSGAKASEISDHVLNRHENDGSKVVRNWIVAAKKIREGGYRLLPAHSSR